MENFELKNYEEQLNHQVIHMDQAVCYCPEFRSSKMMHDYPSRRLQLARAVWKGEMPLSDYIGEINFRSILSRQGERWQNFRENAEDCTDATILCRQMLLEKGYHAKETEAFKKAVQEKDPVLFPEVTWNIETDVSSKTKLLLDENSALLAKDCEQNLAKWLEQKKIGISNPVKAQYLGFEYFACGLVEEGKEHLKKLIEDCEKDETEKVIVLSAKAAYLLTTFAKKLGLHPSFEVVYLPECLDVIEESERTYVYAGSFLLRYQNGADLLNRLIPAEAEEKLPSSQEFTPYLLGEKRANELTIWQKPVGAEYHLFAPDAKLQEDIFKDACADIEKAEAKKILVFEPTALEALKKHFPDKKVVYWMQEI